MKQLNKVVKKNLKTVNSCQSAVKLYPQKMLNLTQLAPLTLFSLLLIIKLGKQFNLGPKKLSRV